MNAVQKADVSCIKGTGLLQLNTRAVSCTVTFVSVRFTEKRAAHGEYLETAAKLLVARIYAQL